jgi:hypothetical protein
MSAGYQEVADKEEKAANIWRLVAAGAVGAAIVLNVALIAAKGVSRARETAVC